jgi:hypothetical protein
VLDSALYICTANWDNETPIWAKIESLQINTTFGTE